VIVQLHNGRLGPAVGNGQVQVHPVLEVTTSSGGPGRGVAAAAAAAVVGGEVVGREAVVAGGGVIVQDLLVIIVAGPLSALPTAVRMGPGQKKIIKYLSGKLWC